MDFAEKINAIDIEEDDQTFSVYFPFNNLGKTKDFLAGLESHPAEIDYRPNSRVIISDQSVGNKISELTEALEVMDDVQRVFANDGKN